MGNSRKAKHPVQEIADAVGGKITEAGRLPDGSGFAIMSMPLSKNHWIYKPNDGEFNVPPMPFKIGTLDAPRCNMDRHMLTEALREAGKYAVRCATMNGRDMDFDPDALLHNLVTGFLGYNTEDGLSEDDWANPVQYRKQP